MRFLYATQPLDGHFSPFVPLGRALQAAGHEVTVATHSSYAGRVVDSGFGFVASGMSWAEAYEGRRTPTPGDDIEERAAYELDFFADIAERMIPDLRSACERIGPDVMIRDFAEFGAWIVAAHAGIPCAVFGRAVAPRIDVLREGMGARRQESLAGFGLDGVVPWEAFYGDLFLDCVPPRWRSPDFEATPEHAVALRPVPFDRAGGERLPEWVAELDDRPTVYVTMGTIGNRTAGVYETIVEGLGGTSMNVVATVGRDRDPAEFAPLPPNVRVERFIPASLLMPLCSAVVAHGGYGTTVAAQVHALPMVIVPIDAIDQWIQGKRMEALGTGLWFERSELTPRKVFDAVDAVLSDGAFAKRAAVQAERIAAMPAPEDVVPALEGLQRR